MQRRLRFLPFFVMVGVTAYGLFGCTQSEDFVTSAKTTTVTMSMERLPKPPEGMIYEAWVAGAQDTVSLGKFGWDPENSSFVDSSNKEIPGTFTLGEDILKYNSMFVSLQVVSTAGDTLRPGPILLIDNVTNTDDNAMILRFPKIDSLTLNTAGFTLEATSDSTRNDHDGYGVWFTTYGPLNFIVVDTYDLFFTDTTLDTVLLVDTFMDSQIVLFGDTLIDSFALANPIIVERPTTKFPTKLLKDSNVIRTIEFGSNSQLLRTPDQEAVRKHYGVDFEIEYAEAGTDTAQDTAFDTVEVADTMRDTSVDTIYDTLFDTIFVTDTIIDTTIVIIDTVRDTLFDTTYNEFGTIFAIDTANGAIDSIFDSTGIDTMPDGTGSHYFPINRYTAYYRTIVDTTEYSGRFITVDSASLSTPRTITWEFFYGEDWVFPDVAPYGWKYRGWVMTPYPDTADLSTEWRFTPPAYRFKSGGANMFPGDNGVLFPTGEFASTQGPDDGDPFSLNNRRAPYPGEDFLNADSLQAHFGINSLNIMPQGTGNIGTIFISLEPINRLSDTTNFPLIVTSASVPSNRSQLNAPGNNQFAFFRMTPRTGTVRGDLYGFPAAYVTVVRR